MYPQFGKHPFPRPNDHSRLPSAHAFSLFIPMLRPGSARKEVPVRHTFSRAVLRRHRVDHNFKVRRRGWSECEGQRGQTIAFNPAFTSKPSAGPIRVFASSDPTIAASPSPFALRRLEQSCQSARPHPSPSSRTHRTPSMVNPPTHLAHIREVRQVTEHLPHLLVLRNVARPISPTPPAGLQASGCLLLERLFIRLLYQSRSSLNPPILISLSFQT